MEVDEEATSRRNGVARVEEDDDDWNPTLGHGVVLQPYLLSFTPHETAARKDVGAEQLACDPFCDPDADDDDGRWVAKELLAPDVVNVRSTAAVLNCPGCFTPVCYQCQRHEVHAHQWRAAEVRNCTVDRGAPLLPKGSDTTYFPVRCAACNADVGLVDDQDMYILFQVLESLG
uniref:E2F-associated phosphoprotein n=1 Tax=Noctiluca scintillans TaxID=2966 RepID=A0A7S1AXG4_NOCSC|mmetsp:Transcript_625/g.1664  ORF Transcript_625/g.1664 Transcript_625/m.1664 type:complete len:174 (+) Transcript_625:142-663(+)|eukprot:CAMPEP_0194539556 /NCGR_PEP_ID=MMETSP0253-20130528/79546_1 /TAXON_ID=2966 /ORGANISM="Noctiluca scintillans" /LENGTH=173 /DNA_ID=CAMNT_0039385845 /DNA_START=122 /DNA_END=639 /DNA_ORIENTATION=-